MSQTDLCHAVLKIRFNIILPSDLFLKVSHIKACVSFVSGPATWFAHAILLHFMTVIMLPKVSEVEFFLSLSRGTFRCSESPLLTPFLILVILYEG